MLVREIATTIFTNDVDSKIYEESQTSKTVAAPGGWGAILFSHVSCPPLPTPTPKHKLYQEFSCTK